jgi:hypothetical protein
VSDEQNTEILDFLRALFNRLDARLDDHSRKFDEVITRLGALERSQADLRRDIAELHVGLAAINMRLDNLDRRVTHIGTRLGLVDSAQSSLSIIRCCAAKFLPSPNPGKPAIWRALSPFAGEQRQGDALKGKVGPLKSGFRAVGGQIMGEVEDLAAIGNIARCGLAA